MTHRESLFSTSDIFLLIYDVCVTLDITLEGEILEMDSEEKLHPVSR